MFNLQEHQDVDIDSTNLTERSLAFLLSRETFLIINNIHFFFYFDIYLLLFKIINNYNLSIIFNFSIIF